jgi:hypothetical protein
MPWSEVYSGVYQRAIGENEQFIKIIGDRAHPLGREHWSITSKAGFELVKDAGNADLVSTCRDAWKRLRFHHPSIASEAQGSHLTYSTPSRDELDAWTDETFHTHSAGVSLDDLIAGFKPSNLVTAHLLLDQPAIVLHFPHWRTDGYGALLLVNAFLEQLTLAITEAKAQHAWGDEAARLVPTIEEVLELPDEASQEVCEQAKKFLATAGLLYSTIGLGGSPGTENKLPSGTRGVNVRFSSQETSSILEACHELEISLEAAIQASCATITYEEASTSDREKPYTSTMRFSLRPFMRSPYDGPTFASALCTGGYLEQVPAAQSWIVNARHYEKKYKIGITEEFLNTRRQYAKECLAALGRVPPPPPPNSSEIDISSVGDASRLVSPEHFDSAGRLVLKVKDVSIGVETLSRQVYCFVWLYHGQLELRLVYNEAFYSVDRMELMVGNLRKVLFKKLLKRSVIL